MKESDFVKSARLKAKLTQMQLAHQIGYTSGQIISNVERGIANLPPESVKDFCRVTNAKPEEFIKIKVQEEKERLRKIIIE